MAKLYGSLFFAAIVMGMIYWVNDVIKERDSYKGQVTTLTKDLVDANASLKTEREALTTAAENARVHQINEEKIRDEAKKLHDCIADKSCVAVVRVKATCPTATGSNANNPGDTQYTIAELDPDSAETRAYLEEQMRLREELYADCQRTLDAWQWPQPGKTNERF